MRHTSLGDSSHLEMSKDALQSWKLKIYQFQRRVFSESRYQNGQGQLFAEVQAWDVAQIDPFQLTQQNIEFWRWPVDEPGLAALYFVIDHELPLLLYVGETCKANERWKGVHDCKRYVQHYISAHRPHDLRVSVRIGFWTHAPIETTPRQKMESNLIHQWRSPFNKENWKHWGTPFTWGKSSASHL